MPAARALAATGCGGKAGFPAVAAGDIMALMSKIIKVAGGGWENKVEVQYAHHL